MKNLFLYKVGLIVLFVVMFTLSYLLGSFAYGDEVSESVTSAEVLQTRKVEIPNVSYSANTYYNVPLAKNEQDFVSGLCRAYGVPEKFVYAVMKVESDFDRNAIAGNDYGIMQINTVNHECMCRILGVDDFLDFFDNSKCGVYLLGQYFEKYQDLNMSAMAYHYGVRGAGKYWAEDVYSTPYTDAINEAMNYIIVDNTIY